MDKIKVLREQKIHLRSFGQKKAKKHVPDDIPEWLLAFDKIHEKDRKIDERCKLSSRRDKPYSKNTEQLHKAKRQQRLQELPAYPINKS